MENTKQPGLDDLAARPEEEGTILEFFKLLEKANTSIVFQSRSGKGQKSACKEEIPVPIKVVKPKVHVGGTAWVGLEIGGERIRTETIECCKRFVTWVKEVMGLLKRQIESAAEGQLLGQISVPAEVCFIPVMNLSGWMDPLPA